MKITKGFKKVRELVSERGKYVANCNSCRMFYQGEDDAEECCHNNEVTKFDMVEEENKSFCTFWSCERGDKIEKD